MIYADATLTISCSENSVTEQQQQQNVADDLFVNDILLLTLPNMCAHKFHIQLT